MEENDKEFEADSRSIVRPLRQVAQEVLDFSSQYSCNTSHSYSASNLAGQAKSYPNYGDFQTSFVLVNIYNFVIIFAGVVLKLN